MGMPRNLTTTRTLIIATRTFTMDLLVLTMRMMSLAREREAIEAV